MKIQLKHSNVLDSGSAKQPTAPNMLDGEIAVNFNASDPAIFIKNSDGNIVRIAGKDNLAFTGYEATIQAASTPPAGLEAGNLYFDTDDNRLYYYYNNGSTTQWVDASTEKFDVTIIPDPTNLNHQSGTLDDRYVNSNGDTMTGNLVLNAGLNLNASDVFLNNGKVVFEGANADAHETQLTVIEPTADRTLSLPDTTGTIVSTGDTGTITSTMIADGTIQNSDVSNSAAIALSKLATGTLPAGITVASSNIVNGTIVDADISSTAAITLSKLGTGALPSGVTITSSGIAGGVATSDIAAGALPNNVTVSSTNIVDGSIVNADISGTAEIAVSKLADGTSYQLLQTNAAGNGVEWASNIDVPGTLNVTGIGTFDSNVSVAGNLAVTGSTISLNANIVTVKDNNIQLGVVSTPTDTTADGGGITLKGSTDKTFNWLNSSDSWTSSENLDLASGKAYYINGSEVLNQTSLASGVTGSSLTSVGTISNGTWQGNQITDTYLATISTSGKVANAATTATNLNSGNAIVARDGSGDFAARNITASLIGNADSADKLSTARTISLTGDLTGSASFDGTANIAISTSANFTGTTNLSYITGTRTVASDTGTNAVLPLFSSNDAGLTGASGGGTVNYLRADGSWASPPGTATNLGYVVGTSTITSSTGTGVALPLFSSSNSGLVQGSGGGTTKFLRADGNWIALGSSSTSIGVNPPTNPAPGDSWFDTDEGRTYIYYQDTDSSQWIESNPSWNGGIPVGSVIPSYLSTGGPNWDASGNLTATGSITAASGVITGSLTSGGNNVLTAGDTGTVTTTIIADDAITQAKLDDGSVSASKLTADSVTTTKIANAAITSAKLATEAVATTNITDASVTTAKIADDAVTAAKLADTSVTAGSYTVSSITVDAQGRVTSASSGTVPAANKITQGNTEAEVVDTGTNGHFQVTTEGTERFRIESSGSVIIKGDSTNGSGELTLNCENNSHGVKVKGPPHSAGANYTLTLPNNTGTNGQVLITNGSGVSSWSTIDLSSKLSLTGGTLTGGLTGTSATFTADATINSLTVGRGGNNVDGNSAFGYQALNSNTSGADNAATGYKALNNNTTGSNNTAAGTYALYLNTTGANNTASGKSALQNNTTGIENVAVGVNALRSNTTGSFNGAYGVSALYTNTSGASNIAIGVSTLYSNTTGDSNTATGRGALLSNTTGTRNVSSGYQALYSNTTGNYNVANGSQALYTNTTGSNNVAVGKAALYQNTTAANNTAIGDAALYTNTTGAQNTATGTESLQFNTTGNKNAAFGAYSLRMNTTGSNNTTCGTEALNRNTTGSSNTATGYNALYSNTTGHSNTATGTSALQSNTTGVNNISSGSSSLYNNTTGSNNIAYGNNALLSNTTGQQNVAISNDALRSNTTGNYNIAIGLTALNASTTASNNVAIGRLAGRLNTTGSSNTAVGSEALYSNTTGNYNVANGQNALRSNTTGIYNVAVGRQTLYYNTTASNNTGLGYQALHSNTTGGDNTAVGKSALENNTTGNENVSTGYNSLLSNITGGYNVAYGARALYSNTTANNNVAVGYFALYSNTTGHSNAALGSSALRTNTTGIHNTATGINSLYANTTGNYNVAAGYGALQNNTTGNNNTANGYEALLSNTTGYSNTAIGQTALYSNTEGLYSTATGQEALRYNTTGGSNVANGWAALRNNSTGANNVAVGREALRHNTTGIYNTAVGRDALDSNTTGSGNIGIGFVNSGGSYLPVFNPTTESDRLVLGHTSITNAYVKVSWTVTSDERDKMNFAPVPYGLDFVNQLKPTAYQFKVDRDTETPNGDVRYGFKAQDILALEGDNPVIIDTEDADHLKYKGEHLVPVLVNAVQELSTMVKELQAEIKTLKG